MHRHFIRRTASEKGDKDQFGPDVSTTRTTIKFALQLLVVTKIQHADRRTGPPRRVSILFTLCKKCNSLRNYEGHSRRKCKLRVKPCLFDRPHSCGQRTVSITFSEARAIAQWTYLLCFRIAPFLSNMLSFDSSDRGQNPPTFTEDCYKAWIKLYYTKEGVPVGGKVRKWQNKCHWWRPLVLSGHFKNHGRCQSS
jgi:hypothetical protein